MKEAELNILVGSLKAQLNVLDAKIKKSQLTIKSKKFADFYGILSDIGETTEEEIKTVEYKLKANLL